MDLATDESTEPFADTGIDPTVPHTARIRNYWLGGKDNYTVDREAVTAVHPEILVNVRESRAFLR